MKLSRTMIILSCIMALTLSISSFAGAAEIEKTGWQIVNTYWNVMEMTYNFEEMKEPMEENVIAYKKEFQKMQKLSTEVSNSIINDLKVKNSKSLNDFSTFYKSLTEHQKPAFEMVINKLSSFMDSKELQNNGNFADRAELFPGYGYADPKYKYKKGLEVGRELQSVYYQDEEKTVETNQEFEGTIDISIAAEFKTNPAIKNFKEHGKPFKIDLGGHAKFFIKVTFSVKKKLVTRAKKQYAVNKVWYELFRAKKSLWSTPEWELCGKTYDLQHEPSGILAYVEAEFVD